MEKIKRRSFIYTLLSVYTQDKYEKFSTFDNMVKLLVDFREKYPGVELNSGLFSALNSVLVEMEKDSYQECGTFVKVFDTILRQVTAPDIKLIKTMREYICIYDEDFNMLRCNNRLKKVVGDTGITESRESFELYTEVLKSSIPSKDFDIVLDLIIVLGGLRYHLKEDNDVQNLTNRLGIPDNLDSELNMNIEDFMSFDLENLPDYYKFLIPEIIKLRFNLINKYPRYLRYLKNGLSDTNIFR